MWKRRGIKCTVKAFEINSRMKAFEINLRVSRANTLYSNFPFQDNKSTFSFPKFSLANPSKLCFFLLPRCFELAEFQNPSLSHSPKQPVGRQPASPLASAPSASWPMLCDAQSSPPHLIAPSPTHPFWIGPDNTLCLSPYGSFPASPQSIPPPQGGQRGDTAHACPRPRRWHATQVTNMRSATRGRESRFAGSHLGHPDPLLSLVMDEVN